jgi:PAS domain S-box-containing protein
MTYYICLVSHSADLPAAAALERAAANIPLPVAVVETAGNTFVASNDAADRLFGPDGKSLIGQTFISLIPEEDLSPVLEAYEDLKTGRLDGYQTPRRMIRNDGSIVCGQTWTRMLRTTEGPDLSVGVFVPGSEDETSWSFDASFGSGGADMAFLVTDHDWSVKYASQDVRGFLGSQPEGLVGAHLTGLVHPGDLPALLLGVTQTLTSKRSSIARLRLRANDGWHNCLGFVSAVCEHEPPRLGIAISTLTSDVFSGSASRSADLEHHLVRIAGEVAAAGLLRQTDWGPATARAAQFADLTGRQLEIVARLVRGERVPEIARTMFLSPSTVRNHLTAAYRRFGVHSQGELMTAVRDLDDAHQRAELGDVSTDK